MTTTCKTCGQERYLKAAGQCRTCRNRHLDYTLRPIGDAKPRLIELINHYGTLGTTARKVGIARNTADRIRHANLDGRISTMAYSAIMNHEPTGTAAPPQSEIEPATWPETAAYARTTEGQEYIERCLAPRKYRRYLETAA